MSLDAIFIGGTQLIIDCMSFWLEHGYKICCVLPEDEETKTFAVNHLLNSEEKINYQNLSCDYVFVVMSKKPISKGVFKICKKNTFIFIPDSLYINRGLISKISVEHVETLSSNSNWRRINSKNINSNDGIESVFEKGNNLYIKKFIEGARREGLSRYKKLVSKIDEEKIKRDKVKIYKWNQTNSPFSKDKNIHELFEAQVIKTPNNTAIIFEDEKINYKDLNEKSNQLARHIRKTIKKMTGRRACTNILVGICVDRSIEMMIAMLGVLKSGAAYVPIEPNYPKDRIEYILLDSNAVFLITQSKYKDKFKVPACVLDEMYLSKNRKTNLKIKMKSRSLMYVIYTSGSTGKPKGVEIEHQGVVNCIEWLQKKYSLNEENVLIQKTSYAFDAAVRELFWGILFGAKIFYAKPGEEKNACYLYENIKKHRVTTVVFVPAMLNAFLNYVKSNELALPSRLMQIFTVGDKLTKSILESFNDLKEKSESNIKLANMYGPTETTVFASCSDCKCNSASIGKAIDNVRLYILDDKMQTVPIGIRGELYIGGVGVGRGYRNNIKLTEERFVEKTFICPGSKNKFSERMYKTGDLVKWLPNGEIEFIGRKDFQIKMRGYRIEPGEIESLLINMDNITNAVVVMKELESKNQINQILVAYYETKKNCKKYYDENVLKNELRKFLPEYMMPSIFKCVYEMPLTSNGKIDRMALSLAEIKETNSNHIKPKDRVEEVLSGLLKQLFNCHEISTDSDIFRLGMHSILAVEFLYKLNRAFNCNIKPKDLFVCRTIEKISKLIIVSNEKFMYSKYQIHTMSSKGEREEWFKLTSLQNAFWLGRISSCKNNDISTHKYSEWVFNCLDVCILENAFNRLINRHEALRLIVKEGKQRVLLDPEYYKFEKHGVVDSNRLEEIRSRYSHKKHVLDKFPLFCIAISEYQNKFIVHFSRDAIILDALSERELIREWAFLYNSSNEISLPVVNLSYQDYVLMKDKMKTSSMWIEDKLYWEKKTKEIVELSSLPLKVSGKHVNNITFKSIRKTIPPEIWRKIKNKAESCEVSLTSVILYIYGKVLTKWSNAKNFVINMTLFGRLPLHQDANRLIGNFTDVSLYLFTDDDLSIREGIKKTHEALWNDFEHRLYDGIAVQQLLREKHHININQPLSPIVLTSVLGEKTDKEEFIGFNECIYESSQSSQVYLENKASESSEGFIAEWHYAKELFEINIIELMFEGYCEIIIKISEVDWETKCPLISASTEDLKRIQEINSTEEAMSRKTLFELFQESVKRKDESDAVIDQNRSYTYHELMKKTCSVIKTLSLKIISEEKLIAIYSEKGVNQIISCISILGFGKAFLPLNTDWPDRRIKTILDESNVKTILVSQLLHDKLNEKSLFKKYSIILIDHLNLKEEPECGEKCIRKVDVSDLAYVIFTSGSTGKPKGVSITHKNVVNTILAVNAKTKLTNRDKILTISEFSFDLAIYDIFGIIAAGGTIVSPDMSRTKDPSHWYDLISRYKITVWNTVPQLMNIYLDYLLFKEKQLSNIRYVLLSGDFIKPSLLNALKRMKPSIEILCLGGATEGSIWSIWHEFKDINNKIKKLPYGIPMPNQQIHVLDRHSKIISIGLIGEIHIGGEGVARGYWRNPVKTKERFIQHDKLGRLYKTGDIGRWHKEGHVEYLGREDHQVKINGYRVELGEIETVLNSLSSIKSSYVIIKNNILYAFLVPEDMEKTSLNTQVAQKDKKMIVKFLKLNLPEYMVPKQFVYIEKAPTTENGKIDLRFLKEYKIEAIDNPKVLPRNEIESMLHDVWIKYLPIKSEVGIYDDFFEMGGDSIIAIQITSIIRGLGYNYKTQMLFENRTISCLSKCLRKISRFDDKIEVEKGRLEGVCPLLPIQKLFFDKVNRGLIKNIHYCNLSFLIKTPHLEKKRLQSSLRLLSKQHDILKVKYRFSKGNYIQYFDKKFSCPKIITLRFQDNRRTEIELTKLQSSLDIFNGPLWVVAYIEGYNDGSARLFFTFHNLIMDTVSWRIIADDIYKLYHESTLQQKLSSYRQWAKSVERYSENHLRDETYWESQLDKDMQSSSVKFGTFYEESIKFSKVLTEKLLLKVNLAYNTEINDLLITALVYTLSELEQNKTQSIMLEGHGRELIDKRLDVSSTSGWFTIVYPIKLHILNDISETIIGNKKIMRLIPDKGIGYSALLFNKKTKLDTKQIPRALFNYLGQFNPSKIKNKKWSFVDESVGRCNDIKNSDPYNILFNGSIIDGKLSFNVKSYLTRKKTRLIKKLFKLHLKNIVNHCLVRLEGNKGQSEKKQFKGIYEPYTIINDNDCSKVLILLHPGDGGSESYMNTLVPKLSKEYKIVLLDNYPLKSENCNLHENFYELSKYYLELLPKELLTHKVYLAGYSFGASVAYEIMQQLNKNPNVDLRDTILIEPVFLNLLNTDEYTKIRWHGDYIPKKTMNTLHIIKCLKLDTTKKYFSDMLKSDSLGVEKISNKFKLYKLNCTHFEVLKGANVAALGDILNKVILGDPL